MVLELDEDRQLEVGEELAALQLDCPVIETERLLLRPPHGDDVEDIAVLANNYNVAKMLSSMPHPYFAADARDFIDRVKRASVHGCVYAVTEARTGRFMGVAGLHEDRSRFDLPFAGYWLGEPYWGKGYASEAARALVDLFFKVTDRDQLLISCRADNHGSRRIIEKCGGRYWKSGTAFNRALGDIQHLDHYRVTRDDWVETAHCRQGN
ncbi:MAG: GNAT family N-acetyltransferase [Nitratireductor sp.]|nr:GNAT family N-acetyltransferase [Nitratireductor sp.]